MIFWISAWVESFVVDLGVVEQAGRVIGHPGRIPSGAEQEWHRTGLDLPVDATLASGAPSR